MALPKLKINQNFEHDFINSKHVIILDEDIIVSYIHNTNGIIYSIAIRNNNQADELVKAMENKKVVLEACTASCLSFTGRGKKVRRNEINFDFVSLSETSNRLVNEHQFLVLIKNERASSIIHHDEAFFLFNPHSMNQYGRYCPNGVL
uniref:Competence protein n=1 Tax=Strongyloides venezuelensis TaxID=75913 RepID=A0A0K0FHY8_STRVS